jgi:hypothetical protein
VTPHNPRPRFWRLLSLVLCAAFTIHAAPALAQAIFGSIQGTVSDESGGVMPGAVVVARNVKTGVASEALTNDQGLYFLGGLRPGEYTLEVEMAGFQKALQQGITLRVDDRLSVDITLKAGALTETVQVNADARRVQTQDNSLGRVIEEQAIKQLPLRGRNAFELVLLTPGAQQRDDDEQPRLSGGRSRTGEFVLDGGSITAPRRGQLFTQPNLDAIQEFKVQTNGLSAEFGRTVGGVVNATLKSGTNDVRGNLFEFHRNNKFNARNFFSPGPNPKLIQNQFGGMIGGPIMKNRLFFFTDAESFRQSRDALFNRTLPTTRMVRGDFGEVLGAVIGRDALGREVRRNQIYDPATTRRVAAGEVDPVTGLTATATGFVRDAFPNNTIPASRFDAPGRELAALYPAPTADGLAQNFTRLVPDHTRNNKFDVRIDYRASDKDLVFGRYSWDHQRSDTPRPFAASSTGGANGNFNRYMTGSLNWTRTLSSTTLNDTRFSFFRGVTERLLNFNQGDQLGIPNLDLVGLPRITVAGYEGLGDAQAFNPIENQFQIQNVTTFAIGRHVLKTGADYRQFMIDDLQLQFTGEYTFAANQTGDPTNAGTTGHPVASLLLGQASSFNNSTLRGRFYYRSNYFGAFVQDTFTVSPTVTLNLGLRYDVEQQPRETRQQGSNFDLALGRPVTMQELGRDYIQFTDKVNFGPRVGLSWQPLGKSSVVRASYGIFYIPLTGRATSAFSRFPADQRLGITSDGLNPAVVLSRTPPIVPSVDGKGFAHDTKIERAKLGDFQQWNVDLQFEALGMVMQASYVGSAGRNLMMNQDYNVIPLDQVQRAGTGTQQMRPYPDYGDILCHCEFQTSSYNALQLGAERRYRNGLFFSTSYTFSKMLDYNEDNFSTMFPQDPYNLRAEYGLSQSHFPHRFSAAAIYDLPFGPGRAHLTSGPAAWLAGGWQVSTIVTLQSGNQVLITQPTNTARTFSRSFRPNLVGDPILSGDERTLNRWFDVDAFQAPAPLTYGDSPKFPDIQGPGLATVDVSLIRSIRLPVRDETRLEVRGDLFNAFNRTNFLEPNGSFGTPNFGRIISARSPRTVQFGVKLWF